MATATPLMSVSHATPMAAQIATPMAAQMHGFAAAQAAQAAQMHGAAAAQAATVARAHGEAAAQVHAAQLQAAKKATTTSTQRSFSPYHHPQQSPASGHKILRQPSSQNNERLQPQQSQWFQHAQQNLSVAQAYAVPTLQASGIGNIVPRSPLSGHRVSQRCPRPSEEAEFRLRSMGLQRSPVEIPVEISQGTSSRISKAASLAAPSTRITEDNIRDVIGARSARSARISNGSASGINTPAASSSMVSDLTSISRRTTAIQHAAQTHDIPYAVGQNVEVMRKSGAWTRATVEAISDRRITVTFEGGKKDIHMDAFKDQIRAFPTDEEISESLRAVLDTNEIVSLSIAQQNEQIGELNALLPRAVAAGVNVELIERASSRKFDLQDKSWRARVCEHATCTLQGALRESGSEQLVAPTYRGEVIGLESCLLENAREELARRQQREEAEYAIHEALLATRHMGWESAAANAKALSQRIVIAEQAGACADLIKHARMKLSQIEEWTQKERAAAQAECTLRGQLDLRPDAVAIGYAIETAMHAGVAQETLEIAWTKKRELEMQAWKTEKCELACQSLGAAMKGAAEARKLRAAIVYAESMGASESLLCPARRKLSELDEPAPAMSPQPGSALLGASALPEASALPGASASLPPALPASSQQPQRRSVRRSGSTGSSVLSGSTPRLPAARDQPPKYGLDLELQANWAAKYDDDDEDEASRWIEELTGVPVVGNFFGALRSGKVLCELTNKIKPGIVAKVNLPGMPFKDRENICNFLKACRALGVQEYALFSTDDLYEEHDMLSVVRCVHALGGAVQRTVPEFQGPHLGVADTSNYKKDFRRELQPATQTGGLFGAMERSHIDVVSNQIVRGTAVRGGC